VGNVGVSHVAHALITESLSLLLAGGSPAAFLATADSPTLVITMAHLAAVLVLMSGRARMRSSALYARWIDRLPSCRPDTAAASAALLEGQGVRAGPADAGRQRDREARRHRDLDGVHSQGSS